MADFNRAENVEINNNNSLAYVFHNKSDFSFTQYKVIKNQSEYLVGCTKIIFNGKIKLIYFTKEMRTLYSLLPLISDDQFYIILRNILYSLVEVKSNGFLSVDKVLLSIEKIYVDPKKKDVKLIYLPTDTMKNSNSTERELLDNLSKIIMEIPKFSSKKLFKLSSLMSEKKYTVEQILEAMGNEYGHKGTRQPELLFYSDKLKVSFTIQQEEFIIGRNASLVDGVLRYADNTKISRKHCKISFDGFNYKIEDLNSTYGTYVNNKKVKSNDAVILHDGDTVILSDSEFKISLRGF